MKICSENINQYIKSFVVPCETGVMAQSTTGKRVVYNSNSDKYEFCFEPTKYVMKRTLVKYRVPYVEQHSTSLILAIFSAEKINKHGLNWEREAECNLIFHQASVKSGSVMLITGFKIGRVLMTTF